MQIAKLPIPSVGVAQGMRIGSDITQQRLSFKCASTNATPSRETNLRYIIVRWKQVDSAAPSPVAADILAFSNSDPTYRNRGIFEVLFDSGQMHMSDVGNRGFAHDFVLYLDEVRADFQAGSNFGTNMLYLVVGCDDPTNITEFNYNATLYYIDQ